MIFHTVVITATKPFQIGLTTATTPCHKVEKNSVNELHNVLNASTTGDIDAIKLFQTVVAIETIPCHRLEKKLVILLHTLLTLPTTVVIVFTIALHTL